MDSIITLLSDYNPAVILIIVVLLVGAIIAIIDTVSKFKGYLDTYHKKKEYEEDTIERIDELEKSAKLRVEKLEELQNSVEGLRKTILKLQENQNKSNIVTCKSAMNRMAAELIEKGWSSQTEYETLSDLCNVYTMSGGYNYVIPSTIERALNLPVLTDDEIANRTYETN